MLDNKKSTEVQSILQLLRLCNILQRRPTPFCLFKNALLNASYFLIKKHLSTPGLKLSPLWSIGWCLQTELVLLLFMVTILYCSTSHRLTARCNYDVISQFISHVNSEFLLAGMMSFISVPSELGITPGTKYVLSKVCWIIFVFPLGRMFWSLWVTPRRHWTLLSVVEAPSSSCPVTGNDGSQNFARQLEAGRSSWHDHWPSAS